MGEGVNVVTKRGDLVGREAGKLGSRERAEKLVSREEKLVSEETGRLACRVAGWEGPRVSGKPDQKGGACEGGRRGRQ